MILVRYTPNSEHLFSLMIDVPEPPNFKELKKDKIYGDYKFFSGLKDKDVQKQYDDALKQCEDSAIGIDNPEVLLLGSVELNFDVKAWHELTPGQTFPLPDSIGYEIQHQYWAYTNNWQDCDKHSYECMLKLTSDEKAIRMVARLKLKSLPEKDLFDQVLENTPQEVKDNAIRQMAVIDFKDKLKKKLNNFSKDKHGRLFTIEIIDLIDKL